MWSKVVSHNMGGFVENKQHSVFIGDSYEKRLYSCFKGFGKPFRIELFAVGKWVAFNRQKANLASRNLYQQESFDPYYSLVYPLK